MRMHCSPSLPLLAVFLTAWALLSDLGCGRPQPQEPSPAEESPVSSPELSAAAPQPGAFWFTDVTAQTGVDFRHSTGTNSEKPFPAANGSGVAALDYDLDGWIDLYFATGTPFPIDAARSEPVNRFYRNLGNWRFEDVTERSGLGHNGYSAGVAVGDYDCDGFADVYVTCYGANCLFHNQGDGTFQRTEQSAHVADDRWATSAAFLDYDGDGLLDLYVCNYAKWTWETNQYCGDRERNLRVYCSPYSVEPELDILYRNRGDGTFEDVTAAAGVGGRAGRSQGVVAADLNGDGRIDLYVANDLHPNFLFLNAGDGTFRDATERSGVGYDALGQAQSSMGVEAADVDGDGRLDLFVTNFQNERNSLYRNGGAEWFDEFSDRAGLTANSLPWVGWHGTSHVTHVGGAATVCGNGRYNGVAAYYHPSVKGPTVSFAKITDGSSNTAAYSEFCLQDPTLGATPLPPGDRNVRYQVYQWANGNNTAAVRQDCLAKASLSGNGSDGRESMRGRSWAWGFMGVGAAYNHTMMPNEKSCHTYNNVGDWDGHNLMAAGSLHPGGVNVAMADGSVDFVSETVDNMVWWGLGSRNGREVR